MRTVWRESRSELMVILENSPVSRYASHLKSRIEKLEAFLEDESYKDDTFDQLKYFESAYLYNRDNYLKARKHVHHPRHTFFELCTAYAELVKEMEKLERSEEHTSELQSRGQLVCRLLLEKTKR